MKFEIIEVIVKARAQAFNAFFALCYNCMCDILWCYSQWCTIPAITIPIIVPEVRVRQPENSRETHPVLSTHPSEIACHVNVDGFCQKGRKCRVVRIA